MTAVGTPVTPQWLRLREPADADARSVDLARAVAGGLPVDGPTVVHDLGCGSGSMGRWLAPMLRGRQSWVLHDRDPDLLALAAEDPPPPGADGGGVTVDPRPGELAALSSEDLAGASLVTASALLDILTSSELDHLVGCGAAAHCPVLFTLSVTGRVRLSPGDPLDETIRAAFNDHQRRTTSGRALLGGGAVGHAAERFRSLGADVRTRPSPWRLDARRPLLTREWLRGWVGAACEQRPELSTVSAAYLARREADLEGGRLRVTVDHVDLLARPRGGGR